MTSIYPLLCIFLGEIVGVRYTSQKDIPGVHAQCRQSSHNREKRGDKCSTNNVWISVKCKHSNKGRRKTPNGVHVLFSLLGCFGAIFTILGLNFQKGNQNNKTSHVMPAQVSTWRTGSTRPHACGGGSERRAGHEMTGKGWRAVWFFSSWVDPARKRTRSAS